MTSFSHAFRVMWRPKFRSMNQLLFFNLIAVVITMLYQIWQLGLANLEMITTVMGWGAVFGFVAFVLLTRQNEQMLVSDTYRLLPTGDTKLYLANLVTSLVALVYVGVVQVVLVLIGTAMTGKTIRNWFQTNVNFQMNAADLRNLALYGTTSVFWVVAIVLWIWVFVNLIHFGTNTISAFLPNVQQRIVKVVLAVILTWVAIRFMSWIAHLESQVYNHFTTVSDITLNASGIWLDLLSLFVAIAVVAALNIFMMKRWVEAKY